MGFFDFLKPKTTAEKNELFLQKIKSKISIPERVSMMQSLIEGGPHNNSQADEDPNGTGDFGLEKTNPIPVNGIDNIPAYMDKLRYKFISQNGSGSFTYNPIDYIRTSEGDDSVIGSKKPENNPPAAATSAVNINGNIDVYNLYDLSGCKLAKVYINCYSLKTSNKVPQGFFHRDEIPVIKDGAVLMKAINQLKK